MLTNTLLVLSLMLTPYVYVYTSLSFSSLFFYSFFLSFSLCFEDALVDARPIDFFIDIVLTIDIVLNFFTAYYKDVELVIQNKLIAFAYFKGFFVFDVISTLPGLFTYEDYNVYALKIFRYLKFFDVITHIRNVFMSVKLYYYCQNNSSI